MIEAIARQYITGSMWRDYSKGSREFCGIKIPDDLKNNQKLDKLIITPSTKGVLKGIPGIPEIDDYNVSKKDITGSLDIFKFKSAEDVDDYEKLLTQGFEVISEALQKNDQIFVDTKFEFGYAVDKAGKEKLIYMDEVGTPDSSRIWDGPQYREGKVMENSKEFFRQKLLNHFPDPDILTNKNRMDEREKLGEEILPQSIMMETSKVYSDIAEKITGQKIVLSENPKEEIIKILDEKYGLISQGEKRKYEAGA
jgi:phosphoribosylaminoimidazole-succinocarboxamide synthase